MEDTKVLDGVVVGIKRAITAKAIISTASIGMLIPFAKLVYWIFDTSYLGGFGISPDVYSRPIFASGFVSIWLVVESLGPMIVGWSILAIVFFVILTSTNIVPSRKVVINENMDENGMDAISDKQSFRDRVFDFFR